MARWGLVPPPAHKTGLAVREHVHWHWPKWLRLEWQSCDCSSDTLATAIGQEMVLNSDLGNDSRPVATVMPW